MPRTPIPDRWAKLSRSKIHEYVLEGKLLEAFSLPRRLVRSMQTMETRSPLPPLGGYDYLPATYMPGSAGRWRRRTAADEDQDLADRWLAPVHVRWR